MEAILTSFKQIVFYNKGEGFLFFFCFVLFYFNFLGILLPSSSNSNDVF